MPSLDFLLPDDNFAEHLSSTILPTITPYRETFYYTAHNGATLYGELFKKPDATAVIVISHGFCEYIGKYAEIIYNFLSLGYSVAICEHRGHGFSDRQVENLVKVHIDNFDTYTADFNYFTALIQTKCPNLPMILYGHSMGGCVAARYLEQYPGNYQAAILTCPMMEIRPSGLSPRVALSYGNFLLHRGNPEDTVKEPVFDTTPDFEHSSTLNKGRFNAYFLQRLAEPRYQTSHGTVNWLVTCLHAIQKTISHADSIHIPILLCQAGQDNLVYPGGHAAFMTHAKNVTLCKFPRAKHEITSADAATRADFWKTIATFLAKTK